MAGRPATLRGDHPRRAEACRPNESVQHVKLLAGMAPTCSMEMLIYDCRLMNQALREGREAALTLRHWLVDSDAALDPQAFLLTPRNAIEIAQAIVAGDSYYESAVGAASAAIEILRDGRSSGAVSIPPNETCWLDRLRAELDGLPADEDLFIATMMREVDTSRFRTEDYSLL